LSVVPPKCLEPKNSRTDRWPNSRGSTCSRGPGSAVARRDRQFRRRADVADANDLRLGGQRHCERSQCHGNTSNQTKVPHIYLHDLLSGRARVRRSPFLGLAQRGSQIGEEMELRRGQLNGESRQSDRTSISNKTRRLLSALAMRVRYVDCPMGLLAPLYLRLGP